METYAYTTYPDSGDSSPRSRDIDCENLASWDDPPQPSSPTNYRVKFMCSYGGKIIPRPHDNQLSYVGGHTKILTVDRTISLTSFISKLASSAAAADSDDVCFKYQLPGEDLDALISVTNSEDLHHMMMEYDRLLLRSSPKPARLRLFLFPVNPPPPSDAKSDRQWFLDALNSAPPTDVASPTQVAKPPPLKPPPELNIPTEEVVLLKPEPVKEEAAEIQRQILQVASQEQQAMFQQRRGEEAVSRVFAADYYPQKPQEKVAPPPPAVVPVPMGYWQERQISTPTAGFSAGTAGFPATTAGGGDQVYLISTPMYRPPSPGQGYYVPRVVQEGYRESPVYGVGPTQAQKVAAPPPYGEGVVRQQGVGVAYDNAGREVYYNAPGGVVTSYQTVAASGVPAVVTMTQEGKVLKPPQTS